jgi:uncharacterized protein YqeY
MSLFEAVQSKRAELRRDAAQVTGFKILTLLVGELETQTKGREIEVSITDDLVIASIKKLIKSNTETIRLGGENPRLATENATLQAFLPQELNEDQLRKALVDSGASSMKDAMKYLAEHFAGQYDKGLASSVAKAVLQ